jgi:cellulose biosynthesis protein BcsQ
MSKVNKSKIVIFCSKKGGVGKSATTVNLAGVAANAGFSVLVVDADKNASANNWLTRREEQRERLGLPVIHFVTRGPDDMLTRYLDEERGKFDFVFVDTGGYENMAFKSAVGVADIVIIPFQPTVSDVDQITKTLNVVVGYEAIARQKNPGFTIDVRLLPMLVSTSNNNRFLRQRERCKALLPYCSISSSIIKRTEGVPNAEERGLTVSDIKDKSRALFELLLDEVKGVRSVKFARETVVCDASHSGATAAEETTV